MANSMRTAWRHFRASPKHFRSRDVINIIFGKTADNDTFLQKIGQKKIKNVTVVTKMLHVYISVTVPDRPIVTIIHR